MNTSFLEATQPEPRRQAEFASSPVAVLGIGGRGCNAVDHLAAHPLAGVRLISANTDARRLARTPWPSVQCIVLADGCEDRVLGAERGRKAAERCSDDIRLALMGIQRLLIVAGMGGSAGGGGAPVAARIALELGVDVHALVTLPFAWEGSRIYTAKTALQALRATGCSVEVHLNDDLQALGEDISLSDAYSVADAQVVRVAAALANQL